MKLKHSNKNATAGWRFVFVLVEAAGAGSNRSMGLIKNNHLAHFSEWDRLRRYPK